MTGDILLTQTNAYGTFVVDLSDNNCSVKRLINNPVFILNLPKIEYTDPNSPSDSNQIVIDLAMLTDRYILQFDLTDGVGVNSKYRTLIMMASNGLADINLTVFTYPGSITSPDYVKIEELGLPTEPGKKDFLQGCSMSLVRYKPLGA